MKTQSAIIALLIFVIFISFSVVSAATVTNWDVSVINGSLSCDSTSKSSIQGGNVLHTDTIYNMALFAVDIDVYLSHNLSIENVNLNSNTVLIADSFSNFNSAHFKESVGMSFIGSEEDNQTVCFSGSSELTSSTSQIDLVSSSTVDEADNIEHSILASGQGNFGLRSSSYKLSGILNDSLMMESSDARLNIFDATFTISSYFQDPIGGLPLYDSEPSHSLCSFHYP